MYKNQQTDKILLIYWSLLTFCECVVSIRYKYFFIILSILIECGAGNSRKLLQYCLHSDICEFVYLMTHHFFNYCLTL